MKSLWVAIGTTAEPRLSVYNHLKANSPKHDNTVAISRAHRTELKYVASMRLWFERWVQVKVEGESLRERNLWNCTHASFAFICLPLPKSSRFRSLHDGIPKLCPRFLQLKFGSLSCWKHPATQKYFNRTPEHLCGAIAMISPFPLMGNV